MQTPHPFTFLSETEPKNHSDSVNKLNPTQNLLLIGFYNLHNISIFPAQRFPINPRANRKWENWGNMKIRVGLSGRWWNTLQAEWSTRPLTCKLWGQTCRSQPFFIVFRTRPHIQGIKTYFPITFTLQAGSRDAGKCWGTNAWQMY